MVGSTGLYSGFVPCLALLVCKALALTYWTVFISAHEFSHFYPPDSLPCHWWGVSEQLHGAILAAGVKPWQGRGITRVTTLFVTESARHTASCCIPVNGQSLAQFSLHSPFTYFCVDNTHFELSLFCAKLSHLSQPFLMWEDLQSPAQSWWLINICWTVCSSFVPLWCWGGQNWTQCSTHGLTRAGRKEGPLFSACCPHPS